VTSLVLYAIVDRAPRGTLGKGLSVVRAAGTHVVVERGTAREVTAASVRAYDRVVRRISRACDAVLPFRFGSVVSDRSALASLLEPIADAVERSLALVRGCVQYTIRVHGRAAAIAPSRGKGPGTRFLDARLAAQRVVEIAPVTAAVAPYVRATRVQRHDRPPLLASVYHLVAREDLRRYRAALAKSTALLAKSVRITPTGPWPPYAFAEVP